MFHRGIQVLDLLGIKIYNNLQIGRMTRTSVTKLYKTRLL